MDNSGVQMEMSEVMVTQWVRKWLCLAIHGHGMLAGRCSTDTCARSASEAMPGGLPPTHDEVATVSLLSARSLSISFAGRVVLDRLDVVAGGGERLGLVGQNGAGKTTLLRLLAGRIHPDSGAVRRHGNVGYLAPEPDLPHAGTIADAVDDALAELRALEHRLGRLGEAIARGADVVDDYDEVLAEFEARDGWSADARAAKALAGLGLGDVPLDRSVATLSGGQRARLALSLALVRAPQILLLDEPTNHLDDEAMAFLEGSLREHRGVVVAASHDRAFLNAVCTSILDLDPELRIEPDGTPISAPSRYTGRYTDYLKGKAAARVRWEQAYAAWTDEVNELRDAVNRTARTVGHRNRAPRDNDKFAPHYFGQRVDAAVARRVRDAEARLARLKDRQVPKPPRPLRFSGALGTDGRDGLLIAVRDLYVPGRVRCDALDITAGARLLVTGPNGAGKSSLLAALAGSLAPERGRVMAARGLRIGWLLQVTTFADPSASALQTFAAGRPGHPDEHQASLVELGLLAGPDLQKPVGNLSVGQQRRLALARLLTTDPHVLLLDEPTNHLSLSLVEELEEAVLSSPLAVVLVSHDRWLRRRWTGQHLTMEPV